jgi:Domain of unknown function (DUF5753)
MDWSLSKIIRIENGSVGISTNDLKALLNYYGIDNADQIDELVTLAKAAREPSWWSTYKDIVSPRLLQLIEYEGTAFITRNFEPLLIPGLLQTEDYARAVIERLYERPATELVDAMVALRMERQKLLDRTDAPLAFFILDESVVRRLVGGKAVMRDQVRQLTEFADKRNVTVEIIPFSAGVHRGMQGPFVALEFPDEADDDVLYLESPRCDLIGRDNPEEILEYREIFEQLRDASLRPDGSLAFLDEVLKEMP